MKLERQGPVGILSIDTPANNAINLEFIREAHALMDEVECDPALRALVVTADHRSIFCPGIDLPHLLGRSREEIRAFFDGITRLAHRKFGFPKPEVYALNGHTIAGGCVMALTGDWRLMARGRFQIGLIEIDVGFTASAGMVEMLRHVLGGPALERLLCAGGTYSPEEAERLGLVHEVVEPEALMSRAMEHARALGDKSSEAYRTVKRYVRGPVVERMRALDAAHLDELVTLWFSEETQRRLHGTVERLAKKAPAASA